MGVHEISKHVWRGVLEFKNHIRFGDVTTEGIYRVRLPTLSRYHNLKKSVPVPMEMSGCRVRN